jgi:hypothetical protein
VGHRGSFDGPDPVVRGRAVYPAKLGQVHA